MLLQTLAVLRGVLGLAPAASCISRASFLTSASPNHGATDAPRSYATDTAIEAADLPSPTPQQSSSSPANTSSPGSQFGARLVTQLRGRGRDTRALQEGVVHVHCSLNNTILTLTDTDGQVKASSSCGKVGFKNANKSTPLATEKAAEDIARKALALGYGTAVVKLKGMGRNKMYAVQSLHKTGLSVTQIQDVTPIPYNGCRLPRKRRT